VDALNKDPKTEKRWSKTETKGLPSKFRAQMNVAVAAVVVVAVAVVVAAVVDDGLNNYDKRIRRICLEVIF
jgi:hypothetical protein